MLNLDSFLQSLLCIVFSLIGILIKDTLSPKMNPRDWPVRLSSAIIFGLGIFFGRHFFPANLQDDQSIAVASAVAGFIGTPLLRAILKRPSEIFKFYRGLNEKKEKRDE